MEPRSWYVALSPKCWQVSFYSFLLNFFGVLFNWFLPFHRRRDARRLTVRCRRWRWYYESELGRSLQSDNEHLVNAFRLHGYRPQLCRNSYHQPAFLKPIWIDCMKKDPFVSFLFLVSFFFLLNCIDPIGAVENCFSLPHESFGSVRRWNEISCSNFCCQNTILFLFFGAVVRNPFSLLMPNIKRKTFASISKLVVTSNRIDDNLKYISVVQILKLTWALYEI